MNDKKFTVCYNIELKSPLGWLLNNKNHLYRLKETSGT